jgi:transposase InsO family protein
MKLHGNAALSLRGRQRVVALRQQGLGLAETAQAVGASPRTCAKWWARWQAEGDAGLADRPSTPRRQPTATSELRVHAIAALRRVRLTGPEIAVALDMPVSTVSGILTRIGLGKLSRLEPLEPANRYEHARPGDLLHVDVKKLGRIKNGAGHRMTGNKGPGQRARGAGWEYVHVCVDDHSRLAYVEVLPDEKSVTAVAFLRRAVAFYRARGITVRAVITDNGPAFTAIVHGIACRALGLKHRRTRPYRPRTNGKAERFIRTMLGGWAYGQIYASSAERNAALPGWLDFYNHRRPHGSLGMHAPISRIPSGSGH